MDPGYYGNTRRKPKGERKTMDQRQTALRDRLKRSRWPTRAAWAFVAAEILVMTLAYGLPGGLALVTVLIAVNRGSHIGGPF